MIDHHVDKLIEYAQSDNADIHVIILMIKAISSMPFDEWVKSSETKVDKFVWFTETVYDLIQEEVEDE